MVAPPRRGPLRGLLGALVLLAMLAGPLVTSPVLAAKPRLALLGDARALLFGYTVTASTFASGGHSDYSGWRADHTAMPRAMGFRYHERNGFVVGTTTAIFYWIVTLVGVSLPKDVKVTSSDEHLYTEHGEYHGKRYDYAFTFREPHEVNRAMDETAAMARSALLAGNRGFDLEILSRSAGGDVSGYRVAWIIGGFRSVDKGLLFDAGVGFGGAKAAAKGGDGYLITRWKYFGVPMRLWVASGPVLWSIQSDMNLWGMGENYAKLTSEVDGNTTILQTAGVSLRATAAVTLLGRLYVEGQVMTPSITSGAFGGEVHLGMVF